MFSAVGLMGFPGSPPRVWGQLLLTSNLTLNQRFTPTRVGTTTWGSRDRTRFTVHPHACGDNAANPIPNPTEAGSPPRVWGQPGHRTAGGGNPRFTPTRVGTTYGAKAVVVTPAVHPHACGDNAADLPELALNRGSPPRVWGQRPTITISGGAPRFTPTRVGTTPIARAPQVRSRGSPPRVWGQQCGVVDIREHDRFTPTRVGTTLACPTCCSVTPVHPHACGDNLIRPSG